MPADHLPEGLPAELLDKLQPVPHDHDGLLGYVSLICDQGIGTCTDRACVCRCHNTATFAELDPKRSAGRRDWLAGVRDDLPDLDPAFWDDVPAEPGPTRTCQRCGTSWTADVATCPHCQDAHPASEPIRSGCGHTSGIHDEYCDQSWHEGVADERDGLRRQLAIADATVAVSDRTAREIAAERDELRRRVAELERQRDQVLAIVDRQPIDARRAYADIRKIYGGGGDDRGVLMRAYERDAATVEAAGRGKEGEA